MSKEVFAIGPRSVRYRQPSIDPVVVANLDDASKGPGSNIQTVASRSSQSARSINASSSSSSSTSGNRVRYRVRRGDTLSGIARKYGTSVSRIKSWNGLRSSRIRAGQVLTLYTGGGGGPVVHRVARGHTLIAIARRYGVSVSSIKRANGLRSDRIYVGQRLTIPQ